MTPVLYDKSERDFSHNGIGFLSDATKATVTEERNGVFELSLQYPISGAWFDLIQNGSIIKAKPNETSEPQLFRVYKVSKPLNGIVTYSAEHISYDLNGVPALGFSLSSTTAEAVMERAVNDAVVPCPYAVHSDITDNRPFAVEGPASVRSIFGAVRDGFGGEFEFDNFTVYLHKARGMDNGVTIEYGKNLTDLMQEDNISDCYTHILPYAAYQVEPEEYVENAEPETIYVYLPEKIIPIPGADAFGHTKVYPINFSDRFEDGADYTESALRGLAEDYLLDTDIGVPKVNLTVSFVQLWQTEEYKNIASLERVKLCDIVTVKFPRLGVESKAEVIKTVFDVLGERYESIALGDVKETLADTIIEAEKEIKTIKKSNDRIEAHIKRTDERITLEVLHIVENEKELLSRIELTESSITAEVSRATEEEGKLSSRITQNAESITSEVTRATGAEENLSSKITQTVNAIRLSVSSLTANDQTESTISITNGATVLNSVKVTGTTAEQASKIAVDAVKGITLTATNSTTGASSTIAIKSGATEISSAKIEFTGLVTFANLKDGKTEISGNNITTGTISADRIDVDKLKISSVYMQAGTYANEQKVVIFTEGTYNSTHLFLGGSKTWTSSSVNSTSILAASAVYLGTQYGSYNTPVQATNLVFDTANRTIHQYHNSYGWKLGTYSNPFADLYTTTAHIGTNSSYSQIGFFGATAQSKKTVSKASTSSSITAASVATSLNALIDALKGYGLIG